MQSSLGYSADFLRAVPSGQSAGPFVTLELTGDRDVIGTDCAIDPQDNSPKREGTSPAYLSFPVSRHQSTVLISPPESGVCGS